MNEDMGRITASVKINNVAHPSLGLECEALVDTGASLMVLPSAWKSRIGPLELIANIQVETATQTLVPAEVCGPVRIQLEGFRPIFNEVIFVDMEPSDGNYEPLIGYIVLEQSMASVDMLEHRLVPVRHLDLKTLPQRGIVRSGKLPSNMLRW